MKTIIFFILAMFLWACQENYLSSDSMKVKSDSDSHVRIWLDKQVGPSSRAVSLKDKQWKTGDFISVKFLNGSEELQNKVKRYASEWMKYANVTIGFVSSRSDADVKIGFDMYDYYISWATTGTDCKLIPQDQPSLNFVWLQDETDEATIRAEVLKGFGHVLGLVFEHQNPEAPFQIKPTADIAGDLNIPEEIAEEIRKQYTTGQTNYTKYDKFSIMAIGLERSWVTNPRYATPSNYDFSINDTAFIRQLYPPSPAFVKMETVKDSVYLELVNINALIVPVFIDWGDGESYFDNQQGWYQLRHRYTDGADKHVITIRAKNINEFSCYDCGIRSLEFPGGRDSCLYNLICSANQLSCLDVSKLDSLEVLGCMENNLTELDVSRNGSLYNLACNNNPITVLNLTSCNNLVYLNCENISLSSLDLSDLSKLEYVRCGNGKLNSLTLKNNIGLKDLNCNNNNISKLDLTQVPNIEKLSISSNDIGNLDFSLSSHLYEFYCSDNNFTSLDLHGLRINTLDCSNNKIEVLNLNGCPMKDLDCSSNPLNNLVVSDFLDLRELSCRSMGLTSLDLSKNIQLRELECDYNSLNRLDISNNVQLIYLNCSSNNDLTVLNISANPLLQILIFYETGIAALDISHNPDLYQLMCQDTPLASNADVLMALVTALPDRVGKYRGEFWAGNREMRAQLREYCETINWSVDGNARIMRLQSLNKLSHEIAANLDNSIDMHTRRRMLRK